MRWRTTVRMPNSILKGTRCGDMSLRVVSCFHEIRGSRGGVVLKLGAHEAEIKAMITLNC